jgi:hypothetical protein
LIVSPANILATASFCHVDAVLRAVAYVSVFVSVDAVHQFRDRAARATSAQDTAQSAAQIQYRAPRVASRPSRRVASARRAHEPIASRRDATRRIIPVPFSRTKYCEQTVKTCEQTND